MSGLATKKCSIQILPTVLRSKGLAENNVSVNNLMSKWRHCAHVAFWFLAHLSQRLTSWTNSIPMVRRPSVIHHPSVVHHPLSKHSISLKPVGQSWSNFLCSITGVGERLHEVLRQIDQNSGLHGNRKPPLTYNGKNNVATLSWLFLISSFLYLQVMRTCIKSRTSSNFGQIGPLTTELAALEILKISHRLTKGKWC